MTAKIYVLANKLNGYYELDKSGNSVRQNIEPYSNDSIFCQMFFKHLSILKKYNSNGFSDTPSYLDQEDLDLYLSSINQEYFYIVTNCSDFKDVNSDYSTLLTLPHIDEAIKLVCPNIEYFKAKDIIDEINNSCKYDIFEIIEYYSTGIRMHYKLIPIVKFIEILEKLK